MTGLDTKEVLREYLQGARETLLWKLDGLSEYDIRRPLTPTGTNLLGLVKHQATGELIYFGDVFDGTTGLLKESSNMPSGDAEWWSGYRDQVEQAARDAAV